MFGSFARNATHPSLKVFRPIVHQLRILTTTFSGEQLRDHSSETGHLWTESLVLEEEGERGKQGKLLDLMRVQRAEGSLPFGCQGCLRHSDGLQRHLEKHLEDENKRTDLRAGRSEKRKTMEGEEEEESRLSRQKKKSRLSLDDVPERQSNEAVKEEAPNLGSPPLRLKIKLTPEITKSLDSATDSPSKATGPTRKPSTRPQPTPLVESLGVDVPTPQALALLNKLPHAMDAFSRGSVPRRQPSKPGYSCSICGHKETDREVFQSHIVKHAREGCAQCKECGASFAVEPSWRKHLLLVHGVKLPGLEDLCQDLAPGEGSSDYQDFDEDEEEEERSLVIDTGEEEEEFEGEEEEEGGLVMVCAGCENRFSSQTGLEEHRCSRR